jgi:GNAT superfamily N-acetyltransferase
MHKHYSNEHSSAEVITPTLPQSLSGVLELVRVWTDVEARKQGFATELVRSICDDADIEGIVLMLNPKPFASAIKEMVGGDKVERWKGLEKWYERFGFRVIQRKPIVLMARSPQIYKTKLSPIAGAVEAIRG